jgi:hypothetical protein
MQQQIARHAKIILLDIFWQHGSVVHGPDSRTLNEVQHATDMATRLGYLLPGLDCSS